MILRTDRFWIAAGLLLLPVGRAEGQEAGLPLAMPPSEGSPGQLVSQAGLSLDWPQPIPELAEPENPDRPIDARDGAFQKLIFNSTWLDPGSPHGFGLTNLELKTVFGFPIPSRRSPLVVTPGFAVNYLDGPAAADAPPRVYDATLQFRWWKRFTPRFGVDFAVTPGVSSDFEQSSGEAFRIPGHVAGKFEWTPNLDVVLGAAYLDRQDVTVLPIGGLAWRPTEDLEFNLVMPRPNIARRIYWRGAYTDDIQDWAYVAGEFAGGTWAIRRIDGTDDVLTYRDFRLLLGLERRALWRMDGRLEIGYVFGRKVEFASATPDVRPSDTVMLRAGITY